MHPNAFLRSRQFFYRVTLETESMIGSEHRIFIDDDVTMGVDFMSRVRVAGVPALTIGQGISDACSDQRDGSA